MTKEEAIKIVRENMHLSYDEGNIFEAIKTLVPELAESDDERIRAVILKLVLGMRDEVFTTADKLVTKPKVLAYLERQKERKPVERNEEDEKIRQALIRFFKNTHDWVNLKYDGDEIVAYLERQKEQKPIEDVVKDITKDKETAIKFLKSAGIMDDNGELAEMYRSEQKPAEQVQNNEKEPMEIKFAGKIYKVYGTKELPGGVVGYIINDEPGHYNFIIHPDEVLGSGYGIKSNGSPYPTKDITFSEKPADWSNLSNCIKDCKKCQGKCFYRKEPYEEQKPILIPKFKVGDRIYDKRDSYNRNVIREVGKDYYINAFAQKMDMAYTDANFEFLEHLDNGSTDSKPAEWSAEDNEILQQVIADIEDLIAAETSQGFLDKYNKHLEWLKFLSERFNLLSKQEWSEEDENTLKYIHELISWGYAEKFMDAQTANDMKLWINERLKSLRPQPHKWYIKKGHWYMCIVDKPEYGWTKGKVYQSPEDNRIETDYKGDLTNWPYYEPWFRPATREEIPDSQPHWKPTKVQLDALAIASERVDSSPLKALYNDLKKL